LNVKTLS